MPKKKSVKKEIFDTFKKIRKRESEMQKYCNFSYEEENNNFSLDQKDIWVVSDSSTSFIGFNHQNYA